MAGGAVGIRDPTNQSRCAVISTPGQGPWAQGSKMTAMRKPITHQGDATCMCQTVFGQRCASPCWRNVRNRRLTCCSRGPADRNVDPRSLLGTHPAHNPRAGCGKRRPGLDPINERSEEGYLPENPLSSAAEAVELCGAGAWLGLGRSCFFELCVVHAKAHAQASEDRQMACERCDLLRPERLYQKQVQRRRKEADEVQHCVPVARSVAPRMMQAKEVQSWAPKYLRELERWKKWCRRL
ncbi:hypothetical protein B0T18DRAFT_485819 [Schizothecium vesticola]|uniref:Uncharacterized protein n=1 Tax=Schizothecium vesticola TaxID=314040 RepID=A0AA40F4L0_9PEZI|nr:hypothetical protein B0T18DRAFT_485819 [Schizothecium vesticola]